MATKRPHAPLSRKPRRRGRHDLDLKDLRFFVAVYEAGGFSKASETLGTVQSNVSARILGLERSLGATLFERHWRSIAATARGEELYVQAKKLLASLRKAERTLRR